MKKTSFLIITGASGSGKSIVLKELEDIGYYAVDNLPVELLHSFAHLVETGHADITRAAMVMDIREIGIPQRFPEVIASLKAAGYQATVVSLEASMEVLQARFSETRRVHPLASNMPLTEALKRENDLIRPLCEAADVHLDTSDLNIHELRRLVRDRFKTTDGKGRMLLSFVSFGYKFGLPKEADLVFDVRFLENPFFIEDLKDKDGRDQSVQEFVEKSEGSDSFRKYMQSFLAEFLPRYISEGRGYLTVAVGCTGGQHRSVAIAEWIARRFEDNSEVNVQLRHRELGAD
jgi:UPF0042 nucleotide-binding protein